AIAHLRLNNIFDRLRYAEHIIAESAAIASVIDMIGVESYLIAAKEESIAPAIIILALLIEETQVKPRPRYGRKIFVALSPICYKTMQADILNHSYSIVSVKRSSKAICSPT